MVDYVLFQYLCYFWSVLQMLYELMFGFVIFQCSCYFWSVLQMLYELIFGFVIFQCYFCSEISDLINILQTFVNGLSDFTNSRNLARYRPLRIDVWFCYLSTDVLLFFRETWASIINILRIFDTQKKVALYLCFTNCYLILLSLDYSLNYFFLRVNIMLITGLCSLCGRSHSSSIVLKQCKYVNTLLQCFDTLMYLSNRITVQTWTRRVNYVNA